jgi:hypothetical protein
MGKTKKRLRDTREASLRPMYVPVFFSGLLAFPLSPFLVCAGACFLASVLVPNLCFLWITYLTLLWSSLSLFIPPSPFKNV